jgi:predicted GIY-YIG superfamily endonuclease
LNFIKSSNIGTIRLDINDNNFYNAAGVLYTGDTTDIGNIMWEHYYGHIDFLKENPHLKDYIIYNANHESNKVFN